MAEIDEIKKLSPEERIKRLKKLEGERRKEIEEAEKLMKESVVELEREEKIKQEIPVPQMKAVDIGELFTQEEREVFATKRYQDSKLKSHPEEKVSSKKKTEESTLEEAVWKEQKNLSQEQLEQQRQYGEQLAAEQPTQLYEMAKELKNEFYETGQVDQAKLYALDVATRKKDEAFGGHYRSPTEEAEEQFGSAKSIIKYLRGR
ncbi:hypothetical protein JW707_04150 [Candidatus Woesearchaeota archaeon]|nr:hypothetical protein [Candidatus Woesearchaeota archaeon]